MKKKILLLIALYICHAFAQPNNVETVENQAPKQSNLDYNTVKSDINTILSNKYLANTKFSVAVYSVNLDKWIYSNNYKALLTPASNTKLFTTFTSLAQLGKDYKIPTSVYTDGTTKNGVLNGNIYLVGGGDPLLNTNDIEAIADGIRQSGITKINGNVYGDCSYFDSISNRFQYSNDDSEVEAVAPITALAIEKNIVTIIVTSGSVPGKQVNVQCNPPSPAFVTSVSAITGGSGNKSAKAPKGKKGAKNKSVYQPNKIGITISTTMSNDGNQQFFVNGSLPVNRTYTYKYYIKNPALVAAGTLKDRLKSGGIVVTGNIASQTINKIEAEKRILLYTFFRSINDVIVPTNKFSDNYLAESLFKLNGAYTGFDRNCARSASISTQKIMDNLNIPCDGFLLNDGSGLSRRNLVTTEALVDLLAFSYKMPFAKHMNASLSIAGIDGTLTKRMRNTLAFNNLRAKTGTLRNVSSLSGYVNTKSGDTLIFSCIFNGANVGYYKTIENQIGELLAKY